ncbi:phospholipid carrier-dependent glycosyltransferase [Leptolyngbya sp. GB1-A1]|uniref:dolichyl-phosphate-mannose--protein mannosyltransferase n=2 Tax=Leptolyngbya TaxID=47251 RepID=UPI0019B6D096|nr:phospholipid carrier-dependent glycosyltransferase [Cyanobacteria bacterium FACHB-502]
MPSIALKPKPGSDAFPWFSLGLVLIFLGSLGLRFWELSRFNTLVFDEVYYAKFASNWLKEEIIFTGHPPLSTYIIAFGIWLGEKLPWSGEVKNGLAGLTVSPFSYRWLNAVTGAFIPLIGAAIAYQITHRRSFALIAGFLMAIDGLFLVESRYALNNIYLVLFGLLGQSAFLAALQTESLRRWLWLIFAGVWFGATAAIKWNGLGFLLGIYLLWIGAWLWQWRFPTQGFAETQLPLQKLTQLHLGHFLIPLAIVPALTYYVSWIPYMQVDGSALNFWELQYQTYDYHRRVGGLEAHPYCSLWFSWLVMFRPVAYFYQVGSSPNDPAVIAGVAAVPGQSNFVFDVHAMGNPLLWWFSTLAILLFLGVFLVQLRQMIRPQPDESGSAFRPNSTRWIVAYLALSWAANLLPWLSVKRCTFLYHYMPSLIFAILALAFILDRWLQSSVYWRKVTALGVLLTLLIAFIFWMPLYLGLPLTPEAIALRRWFPSWI